MQLDKTAIVIAQRSAIDIIDLSLLVMRTYAGSIVYFTILGAAPFALLNLLLSIPILQYDSLATESIWYSSPWIYRVRYYFVATGAVFLQAPIALCLVTNFIGQSVFVERQSAAQVGRAVFGQWPQVFTVLGLLRLGLVSYIPLVLLCLIPEFRPEVEVTIYLLGMIGVAYLVRAFRPFSPEILVLERSPLFVGKKKADKGVSQSYRKRSSWLYSAQYNDNFGIHLILSLVGAATVLALCSGALFVSGVVFGKWEAGVLMDAIIFPLCLWTVASWMTVLRFLFYMNSRIRSEGWEIELRFKAEAERWKETLA